MLSNTHAITQSNGTNSGRRWWRSSFIALAIFVSACGQAADSGQPRTDASSAAAQPVSDPASSAAPINNGAVPIAPVHWWNANWDQRTISHQGLGISSYASVARPDNRWDTLSIVPFVYFMMANSPNLSVNAQASWAYVALFRNCESGRTIIDDLTTEFGDRQRGTTSLTSLRQEFLTWASTQPSTLILYIPVQLGDWSNGSGGFRIREGTGGAFSTLEGALASRQGNVLHFNGLAAGTDGTNTSDFWLSSIGQISPETAICPTADRGYFSIPSQAQWSVRFDEQTTSNSNLRRGVQLPALQISSSDAQEFVARNPERRLVYEITLTAAPQITRERGSDVLIKGGRVISARVLDQAGTVLAERTY